MNSRHLQILLLLLLVSLAGCGSSQPAKPATFDRRAMLTELADTVIMPRHEQFVAETEALQAAVYGLRDEPTVENLSQAQEQWRRTAEAWAQVEPFGFRFTMVVHNQIKKWPINQPFIEDFIVEEEKIDEPFIESIGSTSKGLTVIEYFLFSPAVSDEALVQGLVAEPNRLAYLVALTENLHRKAGELLALWSSEGENQRQAFIEADLSANEVQGSISMLANEMIEMTELIANTKLHYPLKGVYGSAQPQAVESPYANYSLPLAAANLQALRQTFQVGYAGYIDFLPTEPSDPPLSAEVDEQFERTIAALEAIDQPLAVAVLEQPEAVDAAYTEAKVLVVLLKADMANHLGITITFSDNDGD
ncbi:MAG: imelysin family protein [Anaerolineae bacterium]|nr:imelysin family protein [Anaerolineae bacterium]